MKNPVGTVESMGEALESLAQGELATKLTNPDLFITNFNLDYILGLTSSDIPTKKIEVDFPDLSESGWEKFGCTEFAGDFRQIGDFPAHSDSRNPAVLNAHYTVHGGGTARFANQQTTISAARSYNDDLFKVDSGFKEISFNAGDLVLFHGGAIYHQFRSDPTGRISTVQSYVRPNSVKTCM